MDENQVEHKVFHERLTKHSKVLFDEERGLVYCVRRKVETKTLVRIVAFSIPLIVSALLFIGSQIYAPKEVLYIQRQVLQVIQEQQRTNKEILTTVERLDHFQKSIPRGDIVIRKDNRSWSHDQ